MSTHQQRYNWVGCPCGHSGTIALGSKLQKAAIERATEHPEHIGAIEVPCDQCPDCLDDRERSVREGFRMDMCIPGVTCECNKETGVRCGLRQDAMEVRRLKKELPMYVH